MVIDDSSIVAGSGSSLREQLRQLNHVEQAEYIRDELRKLYGRQADLTALVCEGVDSVGVLITQKVLSEHVKMLRAMYIENYRGMDYLIPRPMAIAIQSEIVADTDINLVAGRTRIGMGEVLAGITKTEAL